VPVCRGWFRALLLYDVAEGFDLPELRRLIGVEPPARSPGFKLPAPDYVRFERPPVVEMCEAVTLSTGETAQASLRYFEYGVVSLQYEVPFDLGGHLQSGQRGTPKIRPTKLPQLTTVWR